VTFRAQVSWGRLEQGRTYSAADLAGCNMAMLRARGVLVPVKAKRKAPAEPVEPADEPKE